MDGSTILRGLRRRWALVVGLTVLGLVAGAAWGLLRPDHVATVTVLVGAVSDTDRQEQLDPGTPGAGCTRGDRAPPAQLLDPPPD